MTTSIFDSNVFITIDGKRVIKPNGRKVIWRPTGYALIFSHDQKSILMVKAHWTTRWLLPGGGLKIDESIKDGILRECLEELLVPVRLTTCEPIEVRERNFYNDGMDRYSHVLAITYLAELEKEVVTRTFTRDEHLEIAEIVWVPATEVTEDNSAGFATIVKRLSGLS